MDRGDHPSNAILHADTWLPTTPSIACFAACTFFTSCTLMRRVPAFS